MDNNNNGNNGIGLGTVLFIVFLVLKLTDVVDWSWWWITAPLWIPAVIVLLLTAIVFVLQPKPSSGHTWH